MRENSLLRLLAVVRQRRPGQPRCLRGSAPHKPANLPVHLFRFRNVTKKIVTNRSSGAIFPPTSPTFTSWRAYAFP